MALVAYGSNGASEHSLQAATTLRNFVLKVDCESGRIIYASPSIKAALSLDDVSCRVFQYFWVFFSTNKIK